MWRTSTWSRDEALDASRRALDPEERVAPLRLLVRVGCSAAGAHRATADDGLVGYQPGVKSEPPRLPIHVPAANVQELHVFNVQWGQAGGVMLSSL